MLDKFECKYVRLHLFTVKNIFQEVKRNIEQKNYFQQLLCTKIKLIAFLFENRPMLVYLLKFFISQNVLLTSDNTVWQARSMKKLCQLLPKIKFTICYDKFFMCFLNLNANL